LGGLFTLKLAETVDVAKIAVMSAPSEKEEAGIVIDNHLRHHSTNREQYTA
jgi:esterase/lipase